MFKTWLKNRKEKKALENYAHGYEHAATLLLCGEKSIEDIHDLCKKKTFTLEFSRGMIKAVKDFENWCTKGNLLK